AAVRRGRPAGPRRRPVLLLGGLGHEHAVAADDRRRVALVGQRRLPADVFGRTPVQRQVLFGSVALAVRAAPGGPVAGRRRRTNRQDAKSAKKKPPRIRKRSHRPGLSSLGWCRLGVLGVLAVSSPAAGADLGWCSAAPPT